jgi:hypothetical protein
VLELRCPNGIKFGELPEPGVVEVKCRSERCGAGNGVVVLHRFSAETGELLQTLRFADPRKEQVVGAQRYPAAVRSA